MSPRRIASVTLVACDHDPVAALEHAQHRAVTSKGKARAKWWKAARLIELDMDSVIPCFVGYPEN